MFGFRKKKKHHKAVNVPMFANNIICKGNNDIQIAENQNIEIFLEGENNQIVIAPRAGDISGKICICVYGDNNRITIGENNIFEGLFMIVGQNHFNHGKCNNSVVTFGNNNAFGSFEVDVFNSNSTLSVGNHCMFSKGIILYHTDGHPVLDAESGKILNSVREMKIGNHCWVGRNVTILKNTKLADDTIVGFGAVVSSSFAEPHTAIAGNPAKVVKKGITWAQRADGYIENEL